MKSILVVDDDRAVLEMVGLKLRGRYRTLVTTDPNEALAMLDKRPDLVLCDMDMPGMNGMELAARLRKQSPGIPVVFLTGLLTAGEARSGAIKGERVIAKSSPVEELVDCIAALIGP